MYKSRLSRWRLRKNLNARDIPDMLQPNPRELVIDQRTILIIRGRPVDREKIDKYLKRAFGDGSSVAQTSVHGNNPEDTRFQSLVGSVAAVTKPHTPRWIALPDTLQFPEQMIYFSTQFVAGTSRWVIPCSKVAGNWLSAICTANRLIYERHFRIAFAILDGCFEDLRILLLNLDPCFLMRTYIGALSLPKEIGERLIFFVSDILSITLPGKHPMSLLWQKLRQAGIYIAREHAWHILSSYLTELNKGPEHSKVLQELASWACVYYPVLLQLENFDLPERYQRKQLKSVEMCGHPTTILHLKLNLAATCLSTGKQSEAALLTDEVYLEAMQNPEAPLETSQELMLHYRYLEFLIRLANGPQEAAIEAGKQLHQVYEDIFPTWPPWGFVIAGWTKQHFRKLGMADEASKLSFMLDLERHQIPTIISEE